MCNLCCRKKVYIRRQEEWEKYIAPFLSKCVVPNPEKDWVIKINNRSININIA